MREPENHQRRLVKCRTVFDNKPPFYLVEEWWTGCTCPDCRAAGHWRYLVQYQNSGEDEAREIANFPVHMYEEIERHV